MEDGSQQSSAPSGPQHTHPLNPLQGHSSAGLFSFAIGTPGGEDDGNAGLERLWTPGKPGVLVSKVKFLQLPSAISTRGAPHSAVVALKIFLPLPLFLRLLCALDLGENVGEA